MEIAALIPSFGNLAFTIAAFVVALSIIIAVHEFGHYIVGRWSGIRAEVFSLGFGPVLASRVDRHGTRWQVAILPLGGYVKFLGDRDPASSPDSEAMGSLDAEGRRASMHGAPLWGAHDHGHGGTGIQLRSFLRSFCGLVHVSRRGSRSGDS